MLLSVMASYGQCCKPLDHDHDANISRDMHLLVLSSLSCENLQNWCDDCFSDLAHVALAMPRPSAQMLAVSCAKGPCLLHIQVR